MSISISDPIITITLEEEIRELRDSLVVSVFLHVSKAAFTHVGGDSHLCTISSVTR